MLNTGRSGGHASSTMSHNGPRERVRTHMMFGGPREVGEKKVRRKHFKYGHLPTHHDVVTQTTETALDIAGIDDYTKWTGNQRILHYGPLAKKDPFFYYYPKGWDILYPAQFGFFPYRTKKFRGSSPMICLTAFGVFFALGGAVMTYLAYFVLPREHRAALMFGLHPLQIFGPVMFGLGALSLLCGCLWWMSTLQLCNEHLRHTQPHHAPPRKTIHYQLTPEVHRKQYAHVKSPYQPPAPPCPTILTNAHTEASLYSSDLEMKLYPPSLAGGFDDMSTIKSRSDLYFGSPYNTLSTHYGNSMAASSIFENNIEGYMPEEFHFATTATQADDQKSVQFVKPKKRKKKRTDV